MSTLTELGIRDAELSGWVGIAGPAGLPAEVTAWWAKHIATALGQPEVVERMKGMGLEPDPLTGEPFIHFLRDQYDTWGKRIREAGIEPQ